MGIEVRFGASQLTRAAMGGPSKNFRKVKFAMAFDPKIVQISKSQKFKGFAPNFWDVGQEEA